MSKSVAKAARFGRQTVGELLDYWLTMRGMTQAELATQIGIPTANFISMICKGQSKLPLARVPAVADALGISRTYLMRLTLGQDHPQLLGVLEEVFGHMISANEFSIIAYVREISGYSDPGLGDEFTKEKLKEAFDMERLFGPLCRSRGSD